MAFDFNRARQHLQSFNIRKLFIQEMGWDQPGPDLDIPYDGDLLFLEAIAQKRGLSVYVCSPLEDGRIPSYAGRRKIEVELRKSVHEHILIFTSLDNSRQVWQWVRREPGRPTMRREFTYHLGQSGDPLLQRLQKLVITLEEEENLGIVDVTSRVRAAFDVEPVTRRFYDRYSKEHAAFMQFLKGIPGEEDQRWYASVTLNRLMFVYFIQKKLFLNNDEDYLRTKLLESKRKGSDLYYRDFLCHLFFEGFAVNKSDRKPEVNRLLGNVPYLNGGIFQKHQLENSYGAQIHIPDSAFERIFDFFDQYRWHLDERPLRNDREINPDVLGYIFEKYINQKEMGAYYTKEDITSYISRSTILPYLLDQAKKDCLSAFTGESSVWNLLAYDPVRYIFSSVQKGCELDLPPEIEAGINDVSQRSEWNKTASEEFALPTETWREVVARRTRFFDLREMLFSSKLQEVNDLITHNLDIEQFTQELIEASKEPELLRAIWKALKSITVLDPTCGSGAFLFAALNILEPLYEACLERMRVFISEQDLSGENHRPEKFDDFREVLNRVEQHHNERYFTLKSIIVNNLYGVDIMDEAVEICKLRLFLKLIAQVDQVEHVEPLPDIDFNIRTGNTLVGFTSIDEVRQSLLGSGVKTRLPYPEEEAQLQRIIEEADLANRSYLLFQSQQLERGSLAIKDKDALQSRLNQLNDEMNRALSKTYGVYPDTRDYKHWLQSHKPFHWLVNFFGVIEKGGFSVIIGNPPYVEYSKIKNGYQIKEYETEDCGNLYAFVWERGTQLVNRQHGKIGMILPSSALTTERMTKLVKIISQNSAWFSFYDFRPSKLFDGVNLRLSICVSSRNKSEKEIYSTSYNRWYSEERSLLFTTKIHYTKSYLLNFRTIKLGNELESDIWTKIEKFRMQMSNLMVGKNYKAYFHDAILYWIRCTDFEPSYNGYISAHVKTITTNCRDNTALICLFMCSSLFYWWWVKVSNCRDLNLTDVANFKLPESLHFNKELENLQKDLMDDLMLNSVIKTRNQKLTGLVNYREFYPFKSKIIIDRIDRMFSKYYDFSDEELDFIINYDYKYRMGADSDESD